MSLNTYIYYGLMGIDMFINIYIILKSGSFLSLETMNPKFIIENTIKTQGSSWYHVCCIWGSMALVWIGVSPS
jgi:hypothetical protein